MAIFMRVPLAYGPAIIPVLGKVAPVVEQTNLVYKWKNSAGNA
jgi:hypothetical protein